MSFSILGVFSVLYESAKPFASYLFLIIFIELIIWIMVARNRAVSISAPWKHRGLFYLAGVVGLLFFILTPTLTGSGHSHLVGVLDYGVLFLVSVAASVSGLLLLWGPWLLFGKRK
ncbi:hypothetical protein CWE15_03530 [Aliidiomarina taiwanensis]|uniref:Uncharacterized protein n=1 Tax=Aliidiomarina taiwanensis TaxID=946228 RepID=A0A432XA17_9GAMM|nr:hypothetical protein [Aliidiomarina taiwanensis]RUO44252.1 hypothetical protein CWE15_03530 [Aliidiomarina taiwanensis]